MFSNFKNFARMVINGDVHVAGRTVSVKRTTVNGQTIIEVDGKTVPGEFGPKITVSVLEGTIENLTVEGDVDCGAVTGDVSAGGDVTCGTVGRNVQAGGDVTCGNVGNNVQTGGDVSCGKVGGAVMAGGDVRVKSC